jgi:hypothetical protein
MNHVSGATLFPLAVLIGFFILWMCIRFPNENLFPTCLQNKPKNKSTEEA